MKKLIIVAATLLASSTTFAGPRYTIQAVTDDEKLVINGDVYEPRGLRPISGFDEGDTVEFIEGTPGLCTSAMLLSRSYGGKVMKVWCE